LLCLVSRKYKYKKKTPKFTSKIKPFSDLLNAPFGAILDLPAAHFERRNFSSIAFFVSWGSASPPQQDRIRLRTLVRDTPPDEVNGSLVSFPSTHHCSVKGARRRSEPFTRHSTKRLPAGELFIKVPLSEKLSHPFRLRKIVFKRFEAGKDHSIHKKSRKAPRSDPDASRSFSR
jgi:hypothetical protein